MADDDVKGVYEYRPGKWRAHLTIPGQKPATHSFDTKAEAVDWKRAADEAKRKKLPIPTPVSPGSRNHGQYQSFEDVADAWLEHRGRNRGPEERFSGIEASKRSLRNHILPSLGRLTISSVSPADVEALRDELVSKGLAVSTQRSVLGVVKRIFRFAGSLDRKWVSGDPSYDIRPRKPAGTNELPLTIENCFQKGTPVSWQLALALASLIPPMYRIGFWIQVILGLRVGEVFGLTLADWHPNQNTLLVRAQAGAQYPTGEPGPPCYRVDHTKTIAGRRGLKVPEVLGEAMERHIARWHPGAPPNTPLIENPLGGKRYCTYAKDLGAAFLQLNVVNERGGAATTHYLRHLTVTNFRKAGLNERVTSQLVGHELAVAGAARITSRYDLGVSADELQREIDKIAEQMQLDGLTDLDPEPARAEEYVTRLEAAIMLGRSESTIRHWQHQGRLSAVLKPLSIRGRSVALVPRVEVETLIEARTDQWFLEDAEDALGMDRFAVLRAAKVAEIPIQMGERGSRCWFTSEDFDRLVAGVEAWKAFRAEHLTLNEAATRLHMPIVEIRRLTKSGRALEAVQRPLIVLGVPGNTAWVRSVDVDQLLSRSRETARRGVVDRDIADGLVSVTQTAQLLRCSSETVRKLIKAGELETVPMTGAGRCHWIISASVEKHPRHRPRR